MIQTFKCSETMNLFKGVRVKRFVNIASVAMRKLQMIDAASKATDLSNPAGNRLELLKGDRKDIYSIRINDQWRVCFRFANGDAFDVEIIDYH